MPPSAPSQTDMVFKSWAVIFRNGAPIAAFAHLEFAEDWKRSASHRANDKIAIRQITFKGIEGYKLHGPLQELDA